MGSRKHKNKFSLDWASKEAPSNFSIPARNLRKSDLGGVIFGCTHNTINECLTKHLFGLPGPHFPYIKNISEGLVLFLFNYHDRKLYGIFEAAGPGQMNIDRYAWVPEGDNTGYTSFPAQWVPRPPLFWKNIHVAGASVKDRLFVVGGANGRQCSSEVEYLDLDVGKWIPTCPMLSKRLAPAMAELNNALYVTGGYDGASYISSFERHDPREEAWETLPSMKTKKGCHSMVILNEKLYTLGGFDGEKYVPTVECFDTRMGSWVEAEPMNISKGNFGSFVLEEKLYTIGGVKEHEEVMDIVECYKEGSGWEIIDLKAIGKRSHFSAIVA
ncbi:hypothetical protein CTI12_AA041620 [Artemisia annua]|uniref:DCD domain-containing protein n=1 Tax=Artemisia annua TaxID=35608 RepID=A0A2U1QE75_ARTAN|nr:hypothetical protein CTI12_AA041620 [Artemisia annua]